MRGKEKGRQKGSEKKEPTTETDLNIELLVQPIDSAFVALNIISQNKHGRITLKKSKEE